MKFTKKDRRTDLEKLIDEQIAILAEQATTPEECAAVIELMGKANRDRKHDFIVSPDALATIAGNLLGIMLILNYERMHVITTKAIGFVIKGRV